ncbi:MAG: hypothetical protein WCJ64_06295 [Rhodospirillaceae bacterium]
MPNIGKPVLIAVVGLVAFALLAQFVKAALFGGLIYAWIATALAVHCLLVPEPNRHALVNLHAEWTGGHVPVHLGFAAVLFLAGFRLSAIVYAVTVGLWLHRSGKVRLGS